MWELLGPMSMPNYFLEASLVHPWCILGASLVHPWCIPAVVDLVPGLSSGAKLGHLGQMCSPLQPQALFERAKSDPGTKSTSARRHQGGTKEAPRRHQGGTKGRTADRLGP